MSASFAKTSKKKTKTSENKRFQRERPNKNKCKQTNKTTGLAFFICINGTRTSWDVAMLRYVAWVAFRVGLSLDMYFLSSKRFLLFLQIRFDFPQTSNGHCLWYVHVNVMQTACLPSNPRTSVAQLRSPVTAELNSLTKPGNISFFLPTSWPLVFPSH